MVWGAGFRIWVLCRKVEALFCLVQCWGRVCHHSPFGLAESKAAEPGSGALEQKPQR